jgi:purine-binding chemotaxis protein CheW
MSESMQNVLENQQAQKKLPEEDIDKNIVQLVGFFVGEEEFAVPILSIQEIIKPVEHTRVPSTPNYVLGVFNLRGNVIPLIDLRLRFGLPNATRNEDTRYIVIKDNNEIAGFVIDKLTEAIRIKENLIDPIPETHEADNMIYGVGKKDDRIFTILKVNELLKRTW